MSKKFFIIIFLIVGSLPFSQDAWAWRRIPECEEDCPNRIMPPAGHHFEIVPDLSIDWGFGIVTSLPVNFLVVNLDLSAPGAGTMQDQLDTVQAAADEWSINGGTDFEFIVEPCDPLEGNCVGVAEDGINSIVGNDLEPLCQNVCVAWSVTQNYVDSAVTDRLVYEKDMFVCNNCNWVSLNVDPPPPNPEFGGNFDLLDTLLHELGHFVGLGHANANGNGCGAVLETNGGYTDTGAVMDTCASTVHSNLNEDDIAGIQAIYGDPDGDGIRSGTDNCPNTDNPSQLDFDDDNIGDACDTCLHTANYDQIDTDGDGDGNACDDDDDNDGILDVVETFPIIGTGTDPLDPDTDNDGLLDGEEVYTLGTDPLDPDMDGDFMNDGLEIHHGTDPQNPDTDGDGLWDSFEIYFYVSDPLNPDSDGDGLNDGEEENLGTNPLSSDSDGDGLLDPEEVALGTDPTESDTDGDGLSDWDEINQGLDPLNNDNDGDGLTDVEEAVYGTDPFEADTDGDGVEDLEEINGGRNPTVHEPALLIAVTSHLL